MMGISAQKYNERSDSNESNNNKEIISTIVRMVNLAANYGFYRANCLKKSLVIWWLLARRNIVTNIRFAVDMKSQNSFGGHAYVAYGGENISDNTEIQKSYLTLTA